MADVSAIVYSARPGQSHSFLGLQYINEVYPCTWPRQWMRSAVVLMDLFMERTFVDTKLAWILHQYARKFMFRTVIQADSHMQAWLPFVTVSAWLMLTGSQAIQTHMLTATRLQQRLRLWSGCTVQRLCRSKSRSRARLNHRISAPKFSQLVQYPG